jgi:23S rRNA pseudouridine2605 synthase
VDGERVTDPARDVDDSMDVRVDGKRAAAERREVWVVNKPAGVVSTAREPGRRRAVTELVDSGARLYPVGRLDADTTGLILLTNDGELANRLTHPRYGVPKTYRAELRRPPADRDLERLRRGVRLEDGPAARARVERTGEREIEITIREGRKRQVRRMIESIENEVVELERIGLGSLKLGPLGRGESRRLSDQEVQRLWEDSRPPTGAKRPFPEPHARGTSARGARRHPGRGQRARGDRDRHRGADG